MIYIVIMSALLIGGALGLALGNGVIWIIRSIMRASDKSRIQAAMAREAYLNDIYEECLYEEQDKLARKAAKEMSYYDR